MENLGFLKNSRICKIRKNDSPRRLIQKAKSSGNQSSRNSNKGDRITGGTNLAQIPMKPPNRWIHIMSFKRTLYTKILKTQFGQFKRRLTFKGGKKGGAKGQLSHRDPPFPMEQEKRILRDYCRGKGPRSYIGLWALSENINRSEDKQVIMKYSQTNFRKKRENEWLSEEYILLGLNEYCSKYIIMKYIIQPKLPASLGSSYLTHSLQIHYIRLIGPKPHITQAWAQKRDPTITISLK